MEMDPKGFNNFSFSINNKFSLIQIPTVLISYLLHLVFGTTACPEVVELHKLYAQNWNWKVLSKKYLI